MDNKLCRCENCKEIADFARREAEQRKRNIIKADYTRGIETPSADKFTLEEAVFILALERHSLTEDLRYVEPFNKNGITLAPLFEFQNEIVNHLCARGIITISPESSVYAFIFDPTETYIKGYYSDKVLWEFLPFLDVENKRNYLKSLQTIAKGDEWPEEWRSDIPKLWHLIAKYECLEYFIYLLAQRGFQSYKIGEKTHTTFEKLLEEFSVSRIFYLSWMAVRDTIDYIVRENIPHLHGKNIFIGAIQRKAEKAKAEGWDLKHYGREPKCPQTVVSSTFFNLFLELGDRAFKIILPKINGT